MADKVTGQSIVRNVIPYDENITNVYFNKIVFQFILGLKLNYDLTKHLKKGYQFDFRSALEFVL